MTPRAAEIEVIWYLQESDGEACGVRASAANLLEEATNGATGGGSQGYQPRDYMPERSALARSRDRRAWHAFQGLTLDEQAVLRRRYGPRGPMQPVAPGFGEWTVVGEYLPRVSRYAAEHRMTSQDALRELAKKATDSALLDQCKALVLGALERYGAELAAFDAASEQQRMADRERREAERNGRVA